MENKGEERDSPRDMTQRHRQEVLPSLTLIPQHSQPLVQELTASRKDKKVALPPSINNFIQKTYAILQEKHFESVVSWSDNLEPQVLPHSQEGELGWEGMEGRRGSVSVCSFRIHNLRAFEEVVLPKYFKHSNMSSFVRQLNMYNFHKVRGDRNEIEFQHDKFIKNRPELLSEIKRKQVQSTCSIPSIAFIPQATSLDSLREAELMSFRQLKKDSKPQQQDQNQSPSKKESSIVNKSQGQEQLQKIAQLQEINRNLKKLRQQKSSQLKQFTTEYKMQNCDKLNKFMFALLANKIKTALEQNGDNIELKVQKKSLQSLHEVIEHIMDNGQTRCFQEYLLMSDKLLRGESLGQQKN